jgi:hypothetical protein
VFEKLASLRVNFLIVFLGAPLIILMIKGISLLLPPQYYFSFSKLVAGSSEPFIVDPPAITSKKLCEVMAREAISRSAFYWRVRTCDRDFERPLSPEEVDWVYAMAFKTDAEIRKAYRDGAARLSLKTLTDAEVREIAEKQPTVFDAMEAIIESYQNEIGRMQEPYDADRIAALYRTKDNATDMPDDANEQAGKKLADDVVSRIVKAHDSIRGDLTPANIAQKVAPIKRAVVDDATKKVDGLNEVGTRIAQYYSQQIAESIRASVTDGFTRFGLVANRKVVFEEINKFSWSNYLLSILVRLTPVFLFGLACGLVLGRVEVTSASLAAGLAAFLLSWPLMLMWDRLVTSSWADKKLLFFSFYAAYIASFFLTARCAAMIGARLREQGVLPALKGKIASGGVTWRDVAINTTGALAINAVVYAWNIYLPLMGSSGQ